MNVGWQDALTLGLVAAAAVYLLWRLRRVGRGRQPTGCGTCPHCPEPSDRNQLILIDPPKKTPYGDNTTA
jgi:hypothetical protein